MFSLVVILFIIMSRMILCKKCWYENNNHKIQVGWHDFIAVHFKSKFWFQFDLCRSLILVFYWDYTVANGDRYKNGEGNHHVYLFGFREAYLFVQRSGTTLGPRHIVSKWANLAHQRKIIAPELYLDKVKVSVFYPTLLKRNGMLHWP